MADTPDHDLLDSLLDSWDRNNTILVNFLQHMIWHEGHHHGQIKLALKLAGRPLSDDEAGPVTWDIWMDKTRS